jgi:hypothetical protein
MSRTKVEHKQITAYGKFLLENSRPPSKGGNTAALHSHVLEIDGEKYSFLASGSQQWVFKSDTVSFEYEIKDGYKNIALETIVTLDRHGKTIVRGNRGFKSKLRTAVTRMPGSRREQRD